MDNNYYYNQGQYSSGQIYGQNQNTEPEKPKKSGAAKTWAKIGISSVMGLAFGVFGGAGFLAVSSSTGVFDKINSQETAIESNTNGIAALPGADVVSESGEEIAQAATTLNTVSSTYTSTGADVTTVAEALMPSMVSIKKEYTYSYGNDIYSYYFGGGGSTTAEASGSGFIVAENDDEYLIVSNNHVVEDPISLEVTFVDGTTATAYIKGRDAQMDVAVIAVQKSDVSAETKDAIKVVAVGDSKNVKLGEQVVAIGNALGYGQSVTTGIVSAVDRELTMDDGTTNTYIQTDAAINPGNSGGALINMNGEVIGINSSKIGGTAVEGMGYAIPISSVTDLIEEFMNQQTRIPIAEDEVGYIGISLQEVTSSLSQRFGIPVGIYVVDVVEGGGADQAGIRTGDIITKFDGETIESYDDLQNIIKYYKAGTTVKITYQRQEDGKYVSHDVNVTLGTKETVKFDK
jgi:serine protease Do